MDLDFSEEQEMLRQSVRGVCERHSPIAMVRALEDDPVGYSKEFWRQLIDLGLLGLTLPERHGGSALTAIEAAIVYEEFGRALAPSPHFVSSVLSAGVLDHAGNDAQQEEWLPNIATGKSLLTVAWLEPERGYGPIGIELRAEPDGDGFKLTGVKRHVCFASSADRILVLARTGKEDEAIDIFLVDPTSRGVKLTQQMSLSSDTQYKLELEGVHVPASARIGTPGSGWTTWHEVMHDGIILAAAQAIGGADRALEITVQYSKEREQFDKPIGSFQAISHYLADASTRVSGGKTLVYEAAWARASGRPVNKLAPMAKLFACKTYRDVTAMCEQVHGGYGFTVDFDIQLFFRRAKQLQLSWWDSRYLEELVAAAALDGKAA
jgi:alkylation response protein AidB-like acyl-CoA dehydrogenase